MVARLVCRSYEGKCIRLHKRILEIEPSAENGVIREDGVRAQARLYMMRPAVCAALEPRPVPYAFAKRTLDLVGATALLILLAPVFVVITVLVRCTSKGPILYKSMRSGICGEPFPFIKFRSMRVDADQRLQDLKSLNEKDGPIFKIKDDPRVTPIGRFLRKHSLDELPQLFSVLSGHMSLVGPRPPIPSEVEEYDAHALQRLTVKPGITCYWQVMGRSKLTFKEWMDLDHRYLNEMSFWTDLKLLARTPIVVIFGDGAC